MLVNLLKNCLSCSYLQESANGLLCNFVGNRYAIKVGDMKELHKNKRPNCCPLNEIALSVSQEDKYTVDCEILVEDTWIPASIGNNLNPLLFNQAEELAETFTKNCIDNNVKYRNLTLHKIN